VIYRFYKEFIKDDPEPPPAQEGETTIPAMSPETLALMACRKAFKDNLTLNWNKLTMMFNGAYLDLKDEWEKDAPIKAKQPTSLEIQEQVTSIQASLTEIKRDLGTALNAIMALTEIG